MTDVTWDAEAPDSAARVEYREDGISVTIAARSFPGGPLSIDGTLIPWAMVGPVLSGIGQVLAARDRGDSALCEHPQGYVVVDGVLCCPDCEYVPTEAEMAAMDDDDAPVALPLGAPDGSVYDGPPCSELSTAGDWCGACPECEVAMDWIERMIARGPVIVDGVRFRAAPEHGCFYEWTDPDPNGSIGRLWMPMNVDGSPDVGSLTAIEVRYEDA